MKVQVDGLSIYYKEYGSGEKTAVILEGWGTNTDVYRSVAEAIEDNYRVIILDLPGFGRSSEPYVPWGVEDYSAFCLKFFEALSIKNATLIGHSYGGRIIIYLASTKNDFIIDKIVLVDSAGIMPKRSFKQKVKVKLYKIKKKIFHLPFIYFFFSYMIDIWMHNQGSEDYKSATPMMKKCLVKSVNYDLTDRLKYIGEETLLIWGDKDDATPISDGKIMEKEIKNSSLVTIEGTGHYSFLEKPIVFKNILRAFLI